jgi:hypothetical protein
VLATLGSAAMYAAGSLAAWLLARRGIARAGEPLNFRWLSAATVVATGSMVGLIAMAARAEILGLFAVIGMSSAIYLVQTRIKLRRR